MEEKSPLSDFVLRQINHSPNIAFSKETRTLEDMIEKMLENYKDVENLSVSNEDNTISFTDEGKSYFITYEASNDGQIGLLYPTITCKTENGISRKQYIDGRNGKFTEKAINVEVKDNLCDITVCKNNFSLDESREFMTLDFQEGAYSFDSISDIVSTRINELHSSNQNSDMLFVMVELASNDQFRELEQVHSISAVYQSNFGRFNRMYNKVPQTIIKYNGAEDIYHTTNPIGWINNHAFMKDYKKSLETHSKSK